MTFFIAKLVIVYAYILLSMHKCVFAIENVVSLCVCVCVCVLFFFFGFFCVGGGGGLCFFNSCPGSPPTRCEALFEDKAVAAVVVVLVGTVVVAVPVHNYMYAHAKTVSQPNYFGT